MVSSFLFFEEYWDVIGSYKKSFAWLITPCVEFIAGIRNVKQNQNNPLKGNRIEKKYNL